MQQNFATGALYEWQSLDEAFPSKKDGCDCLTSPLPHLVLLQIRRAKNKSAGGIVFVQETQEAEAGNTQVAKVIAIGKNCFRHPDTHELWPEGVWFEVGDYLRIPKFNGFRFPIKWKVPKKWDAEEPVENVGFVMFEPIHLTGLLYGDPRAVTAYA